MGSVLEETQRANRGIMLLCTSVASITRRVGMDNSKDTALLHTYLQSGPGYNGTNAGLGAGPSYPALEGASLSSAQSLPVLNQRGLGSLVEEIPMPNSVSVGSGLRDGGGGGGGKVGPGPTAFQLNDSDMSSPQAASGKTVGNGSSSSSAQQEPRLPLSPPVKQTSNGVGYGSGAGVKSRSNMGLGSGIATGGTLPPPPSSTASSGSSSSFYWPVSYGFRS